MFYFASREKSMSETWIVIDGYWCWGWIFMVLQELMLVAMLWVQNLYSVTWSPYGL